MADLERLERHYRQMTSALNDHADYVDVFSSHVAPVFSEARINYILVYSGAFNPPHIGHLTFLRESLERAGRDLNIIGALIMPCSDEWMQEHKPGDLLLPLDTRHAMLREDGRLPVGIRVPRTPNSRLTATWRDLVSFKYMAAASDVRVRLIQLLSTETSLELDERIQPWPEQCDGTIVSMYGRQSPENLSIQSLEQDPWTKLHEKGDVVRRYQRMIANDKGAIKGFLRVITRGPHEKKSLISSTSIRNLARALNDRGLETHDLLPTVVLGWNILTQDETWLRWRALQAGKRNVENCEQAKEDMEKTFKEAWELEERNSHED